MHLHITIFTIVTGFANGLHDELQGLKKGQQRLPKFDNTGPMNMYL